jgi:alpha-mannosidase
VLENQWYRLTVDTLRGAVSGIFDKELNLELVDQEAEWKHGEFIYELLGNREQMESFKLDNYHREPLEKVWFDGYTEGEVWNTIRFRGNTRAAISDGSFELEIRLFNTSKRIDLAYAIEKRMVTDPEADLHFLSPEARQRPARLRCAGRRGKGRRIDQIPGSSNDWNTVQNYARLSNALLRLCSVHPVSL